MKISKYISILFISIFCFAANANAQIGLSTIFGIEGTTDEEVAVSIDCLVGFNGESLAYPAIGSPGGSLDMLKD